MSTSFLIFTDMDGTLLDHHTYSHEAANKTLSELQRLGIPVIPNTSKTYDELIALRELIGLKGPFIVENGSAVYIPQDSFPEQPEKTLVRGDFWVKEFTSQKEHWLALLAKLSIKFEGDFTHFDKMGVAQIAEVTGLSLNEASRAANRQYGEPVMWLGSDKTKSEFISELRSAGATPLMGGRFLHVSGNTDKGVAMQWLVKEFEQQQPKAVYESIALGDGQNDAAMLDAADIAVRITSPVNPLPVLSKTENIITSTLDGPAGWTECINKILNSTI